MNVTRIKWFAALLPAVFVGLFEFARHDLLDVVPTVWGNLMVAAVAAVTSLIYYHGIFTLLQNLTSHLQEEKEEKATLQERDRIARELHDSVSQALFFMNIKAKEIEMALQQRGDPMDEVRELRKAIKITDEDIRQHIFNLQMASRVNPDLRSAIQVYIENFTEQSGIQANLKIQGHFSSDLKNREKNQLIRIFQEVLWNIRKHAEAECVEVHLIEDNHQFVMIIQDNGKGFDLSSLKEKDSSFGFKIIKERADAIGAECTVQSNPGEGTVVSIRLDLD
jgi:signal transduction histidine kinase